MESQLATALIEYATFFIRGIFIVINLELLFKVLFCGSLNDLDRKLGFFVIGCSIILLIIGLCSSPAKSEQSGGGLTIDTSAESTENMDVEEEEPVEDPMFTATGFYDSSLSKTEKMYLVNDAENQIGDLTVYLQYVVSEGDKTVYETDLIEPGKFVEWIPGESLDVGDHEVSILEQPYTLENGEFVPKFSCVQKIKITIED